MTTTIGRTLRITGEVSSNEDLSIDGRVHGHIIARDGTITIGEAAHVEAEIRGVRVVIGGSVDGGVTAVERIELLASASVRGSLSADRVVIRDGATFEGGIDMARRTIAAKLAQFKTGPSNAGNLV